MLARVDAACLDGAQKHDGLEGCDKTHLMPCPPHWPPPLRSGFILWLCFRANPFRVRFSFIRRLIEILPNFCDRLVLVRWLYIHHEALAIG